MFMDRKKSPFYGEVPCSTIVGQLARHGDSQKNSIQRGIYLSYIKAERRSTTISLNKPLPFFIATGNVPWGNLSNGCIRLMPGKGLPFIAIARGPH
jgi:hypothetical protein